VGQKRRLSIALEALSQPTNFFSTNLQPGLDAESALQVSGIFKGKYVRGAVSSRHSFTHSSTVILIWQTIDHAIGFATKVSV
jgi:ABC-type multidrug transport system ATPase subunit